MSQSATELTGERAEKGQRREKKLLAAAAAVFLIILIFFVYRSFTGGSLLATWAEVDGSYRIRFEEDGKATVSTTVSGEEALELSAVFDYVWDKEANTLTLMLPASSVELLRQEGEAGLGESAFNKELTKLQLLSSTYDYELKGRTLILYDSEMGRQKKFERE